ncbi:unnamed protein product [Candidula unifasciata]|uniref:Uncharacterized protein n=1 Tax=Candidula unifasciata TaxID=100452 RepID=A0A8S4ABU5_9EUPU|nr:unnamed protein product [Candidula unifasciata]
MSVHSVQAWKLDRYARFVSSKANECGQWKHYNDSRDHIVLTVTDMQQLIISQSSVIFESHSLVNAGSYIRGLSRSDSLLFMCKLKEATRRFRIRFCQDGTSGMSAEEACMKAVKKLSTFFPIKINIIENGDKNSTQLNTVEKETYGLDTAKDIWSGNEKLYRILRRSDIRCSCTGCSEAWIFSFGL